MTDCFSDFDSIEEFYEEEQRINDELESALDRLTDELRSLRNVARDLIQYDDQLRIPQSMLSKIISNARSVFAKYGGLKS